MDEDQGGAYVTINLDAETHKALIDIKYGEKYRGKVTIKHLVIEAVRKTYLHKPQSSGIKTI